MPIRILEPIFMAPSIAFLTASAAVTSDDTWITLLIGPVSGLALALLVLWFLKGYYDRALSRDLDNRQLDREMMQRVIELAVRQHEFAIRAERLIEENTKQTQATNLLLGRVAETIGHCHTRS